MRPVFSLLLSTDFSSYCQFHLWNADAILFQAEFSKFYWSGGRLYAHEIVVFYPHSTINFLLFDQGSAIFDFKQLLDTGTFFVDSSVDTIFIGPKQYLLSRNYV